MSGNVITVVSHEATGPDFSTAVFVPVGEGGVADGVVS